MNKAAFVCFGTIVTVFRYLLAFVTIVQSLLVIDMKNHLISPLRDWLSNLIFYSIFASLFVISVTAISSADYAEKNIHRFK
ncbi:unnamed protein product [Macrosiphum euphorbiae]|uniref:CASP-like protein n=1 Tax=Macrosiphum euphorbiae TaxID=13131 RepID=A0AAV0WXA8_9HEMI|nr:unnamed protein product [Macrosiphum euphorbiae]